MTVVVLKASHVPLIRELTLQSPEYFGRTYKTESQVTDYIERLVRSEAQLFWGYLKDDRLLCMLGQRLLLKAPTWVENFVYLDKKTTQSYNLRSTHFFDVLDAAIRHAESTNRYSFLTSFPRDQLETRMKAAARVLPSYPNNALHEYVPSIWYDKGSFDDARILLGVSEPVSESVILQWTKPLRLQGQQWNPWLRKSSPQSTP